MKFSIPSFVKPFLWSYDVDVLDKERDKKRIITNVLNMGTKEATDWLFSTFSVEDMRDSIVHPFPGEWNKKSLNFWSLMMGVKSWKVERIIQG